MNPLISVIIPTYNRKNYLKKTIESVLKQNYNPIEIIIVDDGSTDNSQKCIKKYIAKKNNQLKFYYFYQKNKGVSSARNYGIKKAKGEYLSFLDSDDLWLKNKLKEQMSFLLKQSLYKICYTNELWFRNEKYINQKKIHKKYSGNIYLNCLPLCLISPSSILLHKNIIEKIGDFDESLPVCEDYDYWLRMTAKYPVYFLDKKLVLKNAGHKNQLSCKYQIMDQFRIKALEKMIKLNFLNHKNQKATINMIIKKAIIIMNGAYKREKINLGNFYKKKIQKYKNY